MEKKILTASEVIERAGLEDDKLYMQTDTGAVDTGKGWKDTLYELEREERQDNAFDPDGDGAHLCEVKRDDNGNWIEA